MRRDVAVLSSFPSRITGSQGEQKAFDYIEGRLRQLGATNIHREPFEVAIPDANSRGRIEVNGQSSELFPLWPNSVRTSTCDVSGPLVYGRDGSMDSLRGKEIDGRIVLLEFNSGGRWKNAAKLGAKAIIFLEPNSMPRGESETKFSTVPLDVPRFYLRLRDAGPVLDAAFRSDNAHLSCQQRWIHGKSANLVAEFAGSAKTESINLTAYVDSMSVLPGDAPGAQQALGAVSALELARIFSQRPHSRTLRLVFSGGHFSALAGAREWVQSRIELKDDPGLLDLTLDLSSGSRALASYARGWFYEYRDETNEPMKSMGRMIRSHAERLAKVLNIDPPKRILVDATNNGDGRTWKNNIPGKFALDCEPRVNAGINSLTLTTIEDSREFCDTPFDTIDKVDMSNLGRQTQTLAVILHHVLNDTSQPESTSDFRVPLTPSLPSAMRLVGGSAIVDGNVVRYLPTKSFIPDTPVIDSIVTTQARQKTMMGVRGDILNFTTGPRAHYRIVGLAPLTSFNPDSIKEIKVAAYHVDDKTGEIDFAPSFGYMGDGTYPIFFNLKTANRTSPIVVFPCVSTSIYDLVDPQDLKAFQFFNLLDAGTGSFPTDYYFTDPPFDTRLNPEVEDAQVVLTSPGQKYLFFGGTFGETRLTLINPPPGQEKGEGYTAPKSGSVVFRDTALVSARDILALNRARLSKFAKYRIVSPGIASLQAQAESEMKSAEIAKSEKDWPAFERHARAAWALALRAYPVVRQTSNDVVNGVVFYLFLLIPFSYFMERLVVGAQVVTKQLLWSGIFFFVSFVLLRLIHPAFEIVTNPTMIFIGFIMGVLSLIVVGFVVGKFENSMRAIKKAQSAIHEVDMRRGSVAMAAFNLGVGNMKRRKARTVLTTLTLVVMTFIVLSFTSIVPEVTLSEYPSDTTARYPGMLLRNPGLEAMQLATYRQIANEFAGKATVARRATYYGADVGDSSVLTLSRGDRSADVRAMAGFDPEESKILKLQDALLPGGRWFLPGERNVMVLPLPLAVQLRIDQKDVGKVTVTYGGTQYTVVGIADVGVLRGIVDLDGDGSMPADFSLSKRFQDESSSTTKAFRSYLRLDPASVFIIPAESALQMGADLRSIGIAFDDAKSTRPALDSLMPRLRMNLYASVASKTGLDVRQFSVLQGSKGVGIGLVIIQLLIASVFVLNTMVASVYERTKEIAIFSSIGLAPNHIAMLFFAESLVYGVLGAVFGYFAAQVSARIIVQTGFLPGLTLNFSSTSAVLSATLVMGVVLLSTIYPAIKASRIAAPAVNEQAFDVEPEGDRWELILPFSIDTNEAPAVVEYLAEWLRGYEGYTIGDFVTAETSTSHREHLDAVASTTWLAPYDLGVSQRMELIATPSAVTNVSTLTLVLERISGDPENWVNVNKRFLGSVRRQFLTWRTLPREVREEFRPGSVGV